MGRYVMLRRPELPGDRNMLRNADPAGCKTMILLIYRLLRTHKQGRAANWGRKIRGAVPGIMSWCSFGFRDLSLTLELFSKEEIYEHTHERNLHSMPP